MSSSSVGVNRRAFLRGAFFAREGGAQAARLGAPWGVSPPWLSGIIGVEVCRDCARPCADACEQRIIEFHPPGHACEATPYLNFRIAGCTFCHACAQACPHHISAEAPTTPIGAAVLDPHRCLAWDQVICMSCKGLCRERAIVWRGAMRPAIDSERCTGCGSCVAACPTQALSVAELFADTVPVGGRGATRAHRDSP